MPKPAGVGFAAEDATVSTAADLPADRPLTDAEREYLISRDKDTADAVRKIKARIKGLEKAARGDDEAADAAEAQLPGTRETLKAAEQAAAEAKKARRAA